MSKGWYNLYETNWEVYLIVVSCEADGAAWAHAAGHACALVQDSLASFSQFINDACCSLLDCAWTTWSGAKT